MKSQTAAGLSTALGHEASDKRIEILRLVQVTGSISEAARQAGVSYKAAWQAIDTLSNLAQSALVERAVGGKGGGGAVVTAAGERLLDAATQLNEARNRILNSLELHSIANVGSQDQTPLMSSFGIRTSMRNQLPCTVQKLQVRGQQAAVVLTLPGGATLESRITKASAELLGLSQGQQVLALCKATAVRVKVHPGTGADQDALEGRQTLSGRAVRVSRSSTGDEVSLELSGGLQLVGFAESGSSIRKNDAVQVWLDASSVVIAVGG